MFWIILGLVLSLYLIYKFIRTHTYWSRKNVTQGSLWFCLHDYWDLILRREDMLTRMLRFYTIFKNKRCFGMYLFGNPVLMIQDPKLIRDVTVKDFDHFMNHSEFFPIHDELWGKNLLSLKDQEWRDMRATLSPIFTSSKIKQLFVRMEEIAKQFCDYFHQQQDQDVITIEMKDSFTRFTNDVIANTIFGIKCDSLKEPNNEFYRMGLKATSFNGFSRTVLMTMLVMMPKVCKKFNISFFPKDVSEFFKKVVSDNIAQRQRENITRPDMINLLLEARKNQTDDDQLTEETGEQKGKKLHLSDIDITAQALVFFFAGFDAISSLMSFMAYELALNPDIQQKLHKEIDETARNNPGDPTYEAITKMNYLEMVISESLRKWPPNFALDRLCGKDYTIKAERPDEQTFTFEKGNNFWIPVLALHRDPDYFPNPERFDPERFSDENKKDIQQYTYMPFGSGPRSCIGNRFALIETKVMFYYLLRDFEIVAVKETPIPLKLRKMSLTLLPEQGFWLGLKRRHHKSDD